MDIALAVQELGYELQYSYLDMLYDFKREMEKSKNYFNLKYMVVRMYVRPVRPLKFFYNEG